MSVRSSNHESRRERMVAFYRSVLSVLDSSGAPYLVGGSFAAHVFTGIPPHTKDLDLFTRRKHLEEMTAAAVAAGFRCDVTFPHWLAKIHSDDGEFVDIIFSSGNGLCVVDDEWFEHAQRTEVLGRQVNVCPAEEMIWSKAFIMERERYDGADIAHLLRVCAKKLDWPRLLKRFGPHWRVLMSHLLLFGFVYQHLRSEIPEWVMQELIGRLQQEQQGPPPQTPICFGTLLSRQQYLSDIDRGLTDGRLPPIGTMTPSQISSWTAEMESESHV